MQKKLWALMPGDVICYNERLEVSAVYKTDDAVYIRGSIDGNRSIIVKAGIDCHSRPVLNTIEYSTCNDFERRIILKLLEIEKL